MTRDQAFKEIMEEYIASEKDGLLLANPLTIDGQEAIIRSQANVRLASYVISDLFEKAIRAKLSN